MFVNHCIHARIYIENRNTNNRRGVDEPAAGVNVAARLACIEIDFVYLCGMLVFRCVCHDHSEWLDQLIDRSEFANSIESLDDLSEQLLSVDYSGYRNQLNPLTDQLKDVQTIHRQSAVEGRNFSGLMTQFLTNELELHVQLLSNASLQSVRIASTTDRK